MNIDVLSAFATINQNAGDAEVAKDSIHGWYGWSKLVSSKRDGRCRATGSL